MNIIDTIKTLYESNPSLAAIFGLSSAGLISFLIFIFKSSFINIFKFIFSRVSIQIEIDSRFSTFNQVSNYLYTNNLLFIRRAIFSEGSLKGFKEENVTKSLNIGIGYHIVFFKFRPLLIEVKELESQNSDERKITMYLTFFCFGYKYIYDFFNTIYVDLKKRDDNSSELEFYLKTGFGPSFGSVNKRDFNSVYLQESVKNSLINKVNYFINNKDIYKEKNIPYHLGILLYGPPGTGKTSIIKALASHFNFKMSIYSNIICFIKDMTRSSLNFFYDNDKPCLVVLEDIDLLVENKRDLEGLNIIDVDSINEKEITSKRILHDLLNSLDGITTEENFIIVATTNDLENIDPALIRPGRFDHLIEISYINEEVFKKVVKNYYDKDLETFSLASDKLTVSQMQVDYLTGMSFEDFMKKYTIRS